MAHIRTQRHEQRFGELLRQNGIPYEKEEAEWLNSMNTNLGTIYRYERGGLRRVVYEVAHVLPPDDYIMVSAMFDGDAVSERAVIDALNSDFNPKTSKQ